MAADWSAFVGGGGAPKISEWMTNLCICRYGPFNAAITVLPLYAYIRRYSGSGATYVNSYSTGL
jgi:hypothetical protein